MIYSTAELESRYKSYSDVKGKIMRLTREGKLIKITRGLYEDDPEVNPSYLAIQIYNPSYLSFDYALYIYNLIPEAVYVYTSATFGKRKTKTFINRFGTYTFRDIPKAAFPYGVIAKTDGEYSYHIATPEKALCDKLYTISPVKNMKEFEYLLFEDLRIDEEDFWSLNKDDIQFVSPLYHSTNLDFLTKLLKRGR